MGESGATKLLFFSFFFFYLLLNVVIISILISLFKIFLSIECFIFLHSTVCVYRLFFFCFFFKREKKRKNVNLGSESVRGLGLHKRDNGADELQRLVSMNPVTGIRDVLDICIWKETLDFRIILRAGGEEKEKVSQNDFSNKSTNMFYKNWFPPSGSSDKYSLP